MSQAVVTMEHHRCSCIDGLERALQSADYESAEKLVEKFLELKAQHEVTCAARISTEGNDRAGREGVGAEFKSEPHLIFAASKQDDLEASEFESEAHLSNSKERWVEGVIRSKLDAAVEARDDAGVLRFVKLFLLLGPHAQNDGLRLLVDYLRTTVVLETQEELDFAAEVLEQGNGIIVSFHDVLGHLYTRTLQSMENEKLFHSFAGPDGVVYAEVELYRECAALGSFIMKEFIKHRKLANDMASWSKNVSDDAEELDLQKISEIINEMVIIIWDSERYLSNMTCRVRLALICEAKLSLEAANAHQSLESGPLRQAVEELSGFFFILETFSMREKVKKTIEMDKVNVNDATTTDNHSCNLQTTMLDEVFYSFQESARRAACTKNPQAVIGTVHHICEILNNEYKDALLRKSEELLPNPDRNVRL